MAHDRWQRDKTGLTYLDGRGWRGHVGFGFRTKKSKPSKYERGILNVCAALAGGAYDAAPADHMCLNVTGSDRCKICGARMGEWIPDEVLAAYVPSEGALWESWRGLGMEVLRCGDCNGVFVQDATDSMQGACRCGGELRIAQ